MDEIGEAVGLIYQDVEPLRPEEKLISRDERRWELEPTSAEDYQERVQEEETEKPKRGRSR